MTHTWTIGGCIVYTRFSLLVFIHLFISSFFLSFLLNIKIFHRIFIRNCKAYKVEIWYTRDKWVDVLCILESGYSAYSSLFLLFFFLSNCQTFKCFIILFSGTVRLTKLKLGTHVDIGWMYRVYRNESVAASFLYFSISPIFKH